MDFDSCHAVGRVRSQRRRMDAELDDAVGAGALRRPRLLRRHQRRRRPPQRRLAPPPGAMVNEFFPVTFLVTWFFGYFGYLVFWLLWLLWLLWFPVTFFGNFLVTYFLVTFWGFFWLQSLVFLVTEFGYLVTEFGFWLPSLVFWFLGFLVFFLLILFSGYLLVTYFWLPSLVFHRVVLSWVKSIAKVFFMNFYKCLPSFTRFMRLYCFIEQSLSGFSSLEKVVSVNRYRVYRVSLGSIRFL